MALQSQDKPGNEEISIGNSAPMTLEDYFEMELTSDVRHEYSGGYIQAMAYTSINHGRILWNLNGLLFSCLKGKDCEGFGSDRMLFVPKCEGKARIFYPDMMVVCGEKDMYQYKEKMVALLNPSVLIEVSSDTTMEDDFVTKWRCYKKIKSLKQYIIISQKEPYILIFNRTEKEDEWLHVSLDNEESVLKILDCEIKLQDIYENVE